MVSTCLNGFNMSPWHRRKVYGIVACQVSVTALAAALACGPLQHPMIVMAVCLGWGTVDQVPIGGVIGYSSVSYHYHLVRI
jgi:hypothetical protein